MKKTLLIKNLKRIRNLGYRNNTDCHKDHEDMSKALDRLIKRINKKEECEQIK